MVNALLEAESTLPVDLDTAKAIDTLASGLMQQQSEELHLRTAQQQHLNPDFMTQQEGTNAAEDTDGHDAGGATVTGGGGWRVAARVVALDFAPAYNYHVDRLAFDHSLVQVRAALRPPVAVAAPAEQLIAALRSWSGHVSAAATRTVRPGGVGNDGGRYAAVHLRRNGYEQFCKGSSGKQQQQQQGGEMTSGLGFYGRQRFGFAISDEMCYPSTITVATDAFAAAASAAVSGSSSTKSSRDSREEEDHMEEEAATAPLFLATDVATVAEENADIRALLAQGLRVVALHTAPAPPATTTTSTTTGAFPYNR